MKKLLTTIMLVSLLSLQAQELVTYGWDQWGISSLVPVGADINENTENTFEVESESFKIRMELWDANGASTDELATMLLEAVDNSGISHVGDISEFASNGNQIAYVTGRDQYNNTILVGLILGGTEDSFIKYTTICNESDWNTAMKMLKSVKMR